MTRRPGRPTELRDAVHVTVRLPASDARRIERIAERTERSTSGVLRDAIMRLVVADDDLPAQGNGEDHE